MHDLVHALAKYVDGDTCLHLYDEFKNNLQRLIPKSTCHSSFIRDDYDTFKSLKGFIRRSICAHS